MGDYALRAIKKGEPITINDKIELRHELDTFLEAYEKAANSRDFDNVAPLIAKDAVFWFTDGSHEGREAIQWLIATYWNSVCSYTFRSEGVIDGKKHAFTGRGVNVLKRLNGSWRIIHEHLSK